jgi:hypothetical protein
MKIFDIFKKRKPNHLIIYVNYKQEELFLYKFLSKITYSVGPHKSLDKIIEGINNFISKHPEPLKQINITSFGKGRNLIETTEGKEKIKEVVDALRPIMTDETRLMFTTCFSGIVYRNAVEMSEYLGGIEICAMKTTYGLNNQMTRCKCKEKGYSQKVINDLPKSRYGFDIDEKGMIHVTKFKNLNEIPTWINSGMALEYNKKIEEDGICYVGEQPKKLFDGIKNYLFNIQ